MAKRILSSARPAFSSILCLWLGCNQIGGIREGKPYPDACKTIADCDTAEPNCRVTTCDNERCVYVDAPEGQPLPDAVQTLGAPNSPASRAQTVGPRRYAEKSSSLRATLRIIWRSRAKTLRTASMNIHPTFCNIGAQA